MEQTRLTRMRDAVERSMDEVQDNFSDINSKLLNAEAEMLEDQWDLLLHGWSFALGLALFEITGGAEDANNPPIKIEHSPAVYFQMVLTSFEQRCLTTGNSDLFDNLVWYPSD